MVLEYPAKIVNVQHDRPNWQIDTGPILVPDFTAAASLFVDRLELAYIVFNSWSRAEVLERRPTPVTPAGDRGPQTTHYSTVRQLAVRNEMFAGTLSPGRTGEDRPWLVVRSVRLPEGLARAAGMAGAGGL